MEKFDYKTYVNDARKELVQLLDKNEVNYELNEDMFSSYDVKFNLNRERVIGKVKYSMNTPSTKWKAAKVETKRFEKMAQELEIEDADKMYFFLIYNDRKAIIWDVTDWKNAYPTKSFEVPKKWGSEEKEMKEFKLLFHDKGTTYDY